jgi:hypothetical protein
MTSFGGYSGQDAFDFIAFKENSLGKLNTLPRNSGDLLGLPEPLRESTPYIFKEATERRQTLVARLGRVAPLFL